MNSNGEYSNTLFCFWTFINKFNPGTSLVSAMAESIYHGDKILLVDDSLMSNDFNIWSV